MEGHQKAKLAQDLFVALSAAAYGKIGHNVQGNAESIAEISFSMANIFAAMADKKNTTI